ncbi:hypothetical protein GCM10010505_76120 [Kitasatospora aburaviensis]
MVPADGAAAADVPPAAAGPVAPPLPQPVAAANSASAPTAYVLALPRPYLFTAPRSPVPFSDLSAMHGNGRSFGSRTGLRAAAPARRAGWARRVERALRHGPTPRARW